MKRSRKIKVGVFGAGRGITMARVMAQHPDAELAAVCDYSKTGTAKCKRAVQEVGGKAVFYSNYEKFMQHDMDAVVLANFATEHAPCAVQALNSGRHVVSEVVACQTMAEAVQLVEAVEKSKKVYTFAENYCYFRGTLEMRKLYRRGDIGECLHAEGEYVHDCESIWPRITGGMPNHWRNWVPATFYCTHAVGPVLTITGLRPTRVTAYESLNINKRRCGGRSADGSVILCQMSNGATMKVLPWCNYKRHPEAIWYAVYGSNGMMETDRWNELTNRVHIFRENNGKWERNMSYMPTFPMVTDLSRKIGGHGGSDFYTMHVFLQKILGRADKLFAIDVYQALDMTLPGLLGFRSIMSGNQAVDIPNLRNKKVRDAYRDDHWCCDPKLVGPGQPRASMAAGPVKIPADIYKKQRKLSPR
ncbi:MAG: Gfo/Idh/MocA family protein [Kiritimatiellia bacterium]|nr:Gfo/Idh/MocA family oxidoreductase [Lentisphaerota bacterium]